MANDRFQLKIEGGEDISTNQIIEAYNFMKKGRRKYGVFHKCLFHLHTPSSYDYCLYENENVDYFQKLSTDDIFQIALNEGLFPEGYLKTHNDFPCDEVFTNKKEYIAFLLIAHKLSLNKIELAVLSDHNTIEGFFKLKTAIKKYNETYPSGVYTNLFLGVEVSCADKNHVVGIFDPAKNGIEDAVSKWLSENIMSVKDGTFRTSYEILSDINGEKLSGIGYIAHIDTSNTFKDDFLNQAYRKKLFSRRHIAIGLSDIEEVFNLTNRLKKYNHEQTAYFWDCDSHSIDTLNTKSFWIKGQTINFSMLKNATRDFEIAIRYSEPQEPKQFISGIAIDDGAENFLNSKINGQIFNIQFSDSLNCFIGGRGTGKSTVLNMLNFILGQYLPEEHEKGKTILEFICKHTFIYIYYRYEGNDYVVSFSSPSKEYPDDDILKSFAVPTTSNYRYGYKFSYSLEKITEFAIRNYIEVHSIKETSKRIRLERVQDKRFWLRKFFTAGYSVNDLVDIAGSEHLGKYMYFILFKNRVLSQPPTRNIRSQNGLLSWCRDMEKHLSARAKEVHSIIDSFNSTQEGKLRIAYTQDTFHDIQLSFNNLFQNTKKRWYKKYNITAENVVEYLYSINSRIGLVQLINLFLTRQYLKLNDELSIFGFCEEMTTQSIDSDIKELTSNQLLDFFDKLKNDIFSSNNLELWIKDLNHWVTQLESFGLEFNINNREQSNNKKPIYKRVGELSLGQKVVAMLSFVLSYSEYSQDYTPLIIDQPEDNLDNQYIYKNLVKDLREMKGKRQVIIATHSSTIVTNAKAEEVIVMESDNEHGWVSKTGYPTDPIIIKHIINHLEGGVDSFRHKSFIYDNAINVLS